jgi:DNA mismatch repair protein MutL
MAVTALPQSTVHLLGSGQVLTTPTSLIKELVDNSLDAKATSIDILISSNTLDKLEIRDNGHGIAQEDLDSLGRHGHTSKLRSFEELIFLGGTTLGFRGEALASAVQMGDIFLTTKTDGEAVATKVKLRATGGIEQQTRTSHPVGTTITVLNFMAQLPVRKKTFEKEAAKTLEKISQLLQGYALARPSVKFSLKVAKGGKDSWSYSPRPNGDIRGAVSQVIGRDAAMQCIEKSLIFSNSLDDSNVLQENDYCLPDLALGRERFIIEAFLPMAGADLSKLGYGQYVSIDARPVSHEKGTVKKMVTLFKKYLSSSFAETSHKVKNPFFRLNIKCSTASYDANVEPAKDNVLFGNEAAVIEAVENLLKEVYGECNIKSATPARCFMAKDLDDFELLLARKPFLPPSNEEILQATGHKTTLDELSQTKLPATYQLLAQHSSNRRASQQINPDLDLAWAMDFEERKEAATRQRRQGLKAVRSDNDRSKPVEAARLSHKNRYNPTKVSLESEVLLSQINGPDQATTPFKTSLPDGDPRAYLMRRQRSIAAQPIHAGVPLKPMRAKSMKMPMERIPQDGQLQYLVQILPVDMDSLQKITAALLDDDLYLHSGHQANGLAMVSEDSNVMRRLQETAMAWAAGGEGTDQE